MPRERGRARTGVRGLVERMGGSVRGANAGPGLEISVEFAAG